MVAPKQKQNWSFAFAATSDGAKRESDYDDAFNLSLEICNDPKTASRVATRFIEEAQPSDEASTEKETAHEK
ncbi:hypothetical protein L0244_26390 [bacterium]|nr:hypothetical protein [bacterium]